MMTFMSESCVARAEAEALELIAASMSAPLKDVSSARILIRSFSIRSPKLGEDRVLAAYAQT